MSQMLSSRCLCELVPTLLFFEFGWNVCRTHKNVDEYGRNLLDLRL